MAELRIRFDIGFSRSSLRWTLVASMLFVCAPELGSETVTLSTYYPAPSGVYTKMITTQDTWLARDGGVVSVGGSTAATLRINGLLQVGSYSSNPGSPAPSNGAIYYNSTSSKFMGYRSGAWGELGGPWSEDTALNTVTLQDPNRKVGIGPSLAGFPTAPLDVNGTVVSRQATCTLMTHNVGGVVNCPAGRYATGVSGVMTKYQPASLYDFSPGQNPDGSPMTPVPTGTFWCCLCPGGTCPSL